MNDMLIFGTNMKGVCETKKYLFSMFQMEDLNEVDTILGIKIKRHSEGFAPCQSYYVEKVFQRFEHLNIMEANTPFYWSIKLGKNTGRAIAQLEYASAIGSMMYEMHCIGSDISFSVGKLSRFTSNPSVDHWKAIGRVLGYLKKTMSLRLFYYKFPVVLEGYLDASWITSVSDNKSTSNCIFTLGGGAISWASKKQTCISYSTMELEFIALVASGKEAEWLRNKLLDKESWPQPILAISVYCDSEATLGRAYSKMYNGKPRHIGLRHDYIKQLIEFGTSSVVYVRSNSNLANPLTKVVPRDMVGVISIGMRLKPFF